MFFREGTIEHPGLFTNFIPMKIFNYKLQFIHGYQVQKTETY